jgi:hypothetical protein
MSRQILRAAVGGAALLVLGCSGQSAVTAPGDDLAAPPRAHLLQKPKPAAAARRRAGAAGDSTLDVIRTPDARSGYLVAAGRR